MINPEAGENARRDGSFWVFSQTTMVWQKNKKQQQKNEEMSSALDAFPLKSPPK